MFCFLVLSIDRREQGHIHCHRLFTAAEPVKGPIGQFFFIPIIAVIVHAEGKPFSVVKSLSHQIHIVDDLSVLFCQMLCMADSGAEMYGDFIDILRRQQFPLSGQYRLQLLGIKFLFALRCPGFPFKGKCQRHGSVHTLHKQGHIPNPGPAFPDTAAQFPAQGICKDSFKQFPVLLLDQQLGCLYGLSDHSVKFLKIQFFSIPGSRNPLSYTQKRIVA